MHVTKSRHSGKTSLELLNNFNPRNNVGVAIRYFLPLEYKVEEWQNRTISEKYTLVIVAATCIIPFRPRKSPDEIILNLLLVRARIGTIIVSSIRRSPHAFKDGGV
jgi:hypothetical protein